MLIDTHVHSSGISPCSRRDPYQLIAEFLADKIGFYSITETVCDVVGKMQDAKNVHTLDGIIECDREARKLMRERLGV